MTLRELMLSKAKAPKDLMDATGKARQTVYAWMLGTHRPTQWDTAKVAAVLGVSISDVEKALDATATEKADQG